MAVVGSSPSVPIPTSWMNGCQCIVSDRNPKPEDAAKVGDIWVVTSGDIFVCIDKNDKGTKWKSCCSGAVIQPAPDPIRTAENVTSPQRLDLSNPVGEFTAVFWGEGWKSGNYHYFFRSYNGSAWANDAYYGNGFTVRKNCGGFGYKYLSTPPSGERLIAVFVWNAQRVTVRFYKWDTYEKVYETAANIPACVMKSIVVYGTSESDTNTTLGGEIDYFELYDSAITDESVLGTIIRKH